MRRKIRPLIIGKDGAGKSWLLSTFPKPLWVFLFDAPDKAGVYLDRGIPGEIYVNKVGGKEYGYAQDVFSTKEEGKVIIHLEFWGESNPFAGQTYLRFVSRTANLERELIENKVATAGLDSITGFELCSRFCSEHNLNKFNKDGDITKDGRIHYGFSTHAIEQFVLTRWPNLIMCNAPLLGHYGEKDKTDSEDGETVTSITTVDVPGKIAAKIGTQFAEVWRVYTDKAGVRRVQTRQRPNNDFACRTGVGFEDGVYPHYDAMWQSVEGEKDAVDK